MERPPKCEHCPSPLSVQLHRYLENGEETYVCCKECPYLKASLESTKAPLPESDIRCVECQWSLHQLQDSQKLGCPNCLSQFEDAVAQGCVASKILPPEAQSAKSLYLGPRPDQEESANAASKRLSLEVALKQALHHERYEEAAALRDQIKRLLGDPV